jgi:hypothetical protein
MKRAVQILFGTVLTLSLIAASVLSLYNPKVSAVTASDWNAGKIIEDYLFTYKNSMSVTDVQNFLNQKVGTGGFDSVPGQCDTNGVRNAQPFSNTTRAEYAASIGKPTKFTCLSNYYEVPKTTPSTAIPANNYGGKPIPAGAKSAAQIIWDAAQTYSISPKVLLVTIQKESAGPLTIDDWPFEIQYKYAMGAHCPDNPPPEWPERCDPNYSGFSMQIYESAALFRWYLDNMQQPWWTYKKPYQTNFVRWDVEDSCGGSNVYLETMATAALYTYTPYQPNTAALANMYGTGDSCSAYGNRNFWRIYNDWFGKTTGPAFYAQYHSQSSYPIIDSGVGRTVYFQFKNVGTAFWKDDASNFPGYVPVRLATTFPINRWSAFRADNWLSPSRPTGFFSKVFESDGVTLAPDQHTVQPGQIARFEFTMYADPGIPPGVYREYFQPIADGAPNPYWNLGGWAYLDVGVHTPTYKAAYHSQSSYPTITKGSSSGVFIRFKNTGPDPWFDDTSLPAGKRPVHLATSWPINRGSTFGSSWPRPSRPNLNFTKVYESDGVSLASAQHVVQPGQIAEFSFKFTVPADTPSGTYKEYFEPIVEGSPGYSWNMGITAWLGITVP